MILFRKKKEKVGKILLSNLLWRKITQIFKDDKT